MKKKLHIPAFIQLCLNTCVEMFFLKYEREMISSRIKQKSFLQNCYVLFMLMVSLYTSKAGEFQPTLHTTHQWVRPFYSLQSTIPATKNGNILIQGLVFKRFKITCFNFCSVVIGWRTDSVFVKAFALFFSLI